MKAVILTQNLWDYLLYVQKTHTENGIHPQECIMAHQLWQAISNAQDIPEPEPNDHSSGSTASTPSSPAEILYP